MTAKIVVVGSFNMDLTTYMARLPRPGETVHGRRFVTGPGGKGSNQAVAAARLGAEVTFVGRVGEDSFGNTAIDTWQAEGIDTAYVVRDPENATGVAPILVEDSGENQIVVALGANLALSPADVDAASEAIAEADVLVVQLEIDLTHRRPRTGGRQRTRRSHHSQPGPSRPARPGDPGPGRLPHAQRDRTGSPLRPDARRPAPTGDGGRADLDYDRRSAGGTVGDGCRVRRSLHLPGRGGRYHWRGRCLQRRAGRCAGRRQDAARCHRLCQRHRRTVCHPAWHGPQYAPARRGRGAAGGVRKFCTSD